MARLDEHPEQSHLMPIRTLSEDHRTGIVAHLLSLDESDRYLRFGYAAGDELIRRYVAEIDFAADEVFGLFDRRLELVASAHLACDPRQGSQAPSTAEFGVSVTASARGRGHGTRLFHHAVLRARARGVDMLLIHALTENAAMLSIVRRAGARVEQAGAEAQAQLRLPPDDALARPETRVRHQGIERDYQFKLGGLQAPARPARPDAA